MQASEKRGQRLAGVGLERRHPGRMSDGRGGDVGGRHGAGGAVALGCRSQPDERPGSTTDLGLVSDRNEGSVVLEEWRAGWGLNKKMIMAGSVMIDDWIKSFKVGHKNLDCMIVWVRSTNGDDRSGMKVGSSATEEEDSPRVAAAINVGLRPRRN
ncbi:hypothetical protein ACLOJK_036922 [Asimina triloba]